jgi:NAD(P)-dependent dehydrogenase (short-subunit alcohol dehydrogenase family)
MKNIIITGSSNGFGLKAAKDFADKGNKVYATMRNPNGKNANAKADLESHSTNIKVVDMDVTDEASVKEAMATILAEAGSVDVLINNAGIMYLGITEAFSVEQAKFQMETNYFGAIRVMQSVLPNMRKSGAGLIINTSGSSPLLVDRNGLIRVNGVFSLYGTFSTTTCFEFGLPPGSG